MNTGTGSVTFEGRPIHEKLQEQKGEQASVEYRETISDLCKMTRKGVKLKYKRREEENGKVRYYSNQEVDIMVQQQLAKTMDLSIKNCDPRTKERMEKLLKYITSCISVDGYFSTSDHIIKKIVIFYRFMDLKSSAEASYHRGTMHSDLRRLIKMGLIHKKGPGGSFHYFLGGTKESLDSPTDLPMQPEVKVRIDGVPTLPEMMQNVRINLIITVKVEQG